MIYLNETQKEHIGDHFNALMVSAGNACWILGGEIVDYQDVKHQYDVCVSKMEVLRGMLSSVENQEENQEEDSFNTNRHIGRGE